ncbi:Protein of unknown function [Pyronema omphalodes CBS 100304]|uniref:Uncharacterized protein n=1 Tax=Pyronema omphalodes (strain CBS 100304) TaxID=1076935 RepID=U4LSN7_PYROM|nr:Protein of unknown function [Pyronema omphalodes CBS 100304]
MNKTTQTRDMGLDFGTWAGLFGVDAPIYYNIYFQGNTSRQDLQDNASAELCNAGDNWKNKRHSGRFVKAGYYWAKIGGGLFLSHRL